MLALGIIHARKSYEGDTCSTSNPPKEDYTNSKNPI